MERSLADKHKGDLADPVAPADLEAAEQEDLATRYLVGALIVEELAATPIPSRPNKLL